MNRYRTDSGVELDLTPEQAQQFSRLGEIELMGESPQPAEDATEEKKTSNVRDVAE